MKILGISAYYHDSAAALVIDGKIIAAAQEERFTRKKNTADFPIQAIRYCLEDSGLDIDSLDAVVFYDKPFLKFERLLETYLIFAPKGLISFLKAMPVWLKEKLFLKKRIKDELKEIGNYKVQKLKLLFTSHHLSHAASAFYPSPFKEAAILTIDGVGEWCTASLSYGKEGKIDLLREMNFPHSVGLLYSAFTYYLGFKVNSGEYKLMGLAPYGNEKSPDVEQYIQLIKKYLVDIKQDGSVFLNQTYFNYAVGQVMTDNHKWEKLFGFAKKKEEDEILQQHCNLALAIQMVTEEIVIKMAEELKRITGAENLCMAGGVSLNCVANGKLQARKIFKNIYVQPAAGDSGAALGAALAISNMYFEEPRIFNSDKDQMHGAYLGPEYSEKEVESMCKRTKAVFTRLDDTALIEYVARELSENNVVGWFQGRMEFGPRALGNRSILANAGSDDMQKKLNEKIKKREGFRPFAPSVLAEDANEYFENLGYSPYMLFVAQITDKYKIQLPNNYNELLLWEKLYIKRSRINAITHVDLSARVQTVHRETNKRYHDLISAYKKITGIGLLVNTSFNVRGEPIVCTPYEAYMCFMNTDMDYLVINNFVFKRSEQSNWHPTTSQHVTFLKD